MSAGIQMHFDPSLFALGDKVCLQLRPHLTDLLYVRAISSGDPLRPPPPSWLGGHQMEAESCNLPQSADIYLPASQRLSITEVWLRSGPASSLTEQRAPGKHPLCKHSPPPIFLFLYSSLRGGREEMRNR